MALTNTTQYLDFCSRLMWFMDDIGVLDRYGTARKMGVPQSDFMAVYANMITQKPTYRARPASQEVNPGAHGGYESVVSTGGKTTVTNSPDYMPSFASVNAGAPASRPYPSGQYPSQDTVIDTGGAVEIDSPH